MRPTLNFSMPGHTARAISPDHFRRDDDQNNAQIDAQKFQKSQKSAIANADAELDARAVELANLQFIILALKGRAELLSADLMATMSGRRTAVGPDFVMEMVTDDHFEVSLKVIGRSSRFLEVACNGQG